MIAPWLLTLSLTVAGPALGARILGLFPQWARSHHRFLQSVSTTLAAAGHEVVVYSAFPLHQPPPNYTHVLLENITTDSKELQDFFLEITEFPEWKCIDVHLLLYKITYKQFLDEPKIRELISGQEHFDLIITEATAVQEFVLIVGRLLKAPIITLQAFPLNNLLNSLAGNVLSLSYIPDVCLSFSDRMSFYERAFNAFAVLRGLYLYHNDLLPGLERMMREQFPDMPPLAEMTKNVSLYFVNDHETADYSRPRPPNVIPVAGIHIEKPTPLPKEIQKFMDGASDGVIFFSLGTYVPDELKPREYFDMFINIFKKLKQRVIWKPGKENIEGLPTNVLTLKWAPQQDVLAHPNCVLFITHGGLNSQHETLHFGVPVVGIPQFYDQHRNVRYFVEKGVGVKVGREELSEASMSAAIREVLENPRYLQRYK